jgi:hypothetical protein
VSFSAVLYASYKYWNRSFFVSSMKANTYLTQIEILKRVLEVSKDKDKVKMHNVKVSAECHRLIGSMGTSNSDMGDVVFAAVKHYASCPV